MSVSIHQEQISINLTELQAKLTAISSESSLETIMPVIDDYLEIFELLFIGKESYAKNLNKDSSQAELDFYLSTLDVLVTSIKSLALDSKFKTSLLGKIADNCDMEVLSQFRVGTLKNEGYEKLIKKVNPEQMSNTVLVRTWSTQQEVSSGLKNIIRQQLSGEGVGHASVTMRLKADDRGEELINKYCLKEDGSIKIPYEIKKYGQETVYEVYWSYWPEGLQTLESDIATEHHAVEYKDNAELLREMPLELKVRYLTQKYTREKSLPLIGSLNDSEKPIFKSNVPGSRVIGLTPVAEFDVSGIETDIYRRNYLDLKIKQYKVQEELHALELLNDNYLEKDKAFDVTAMTDVTSIKANSNFLILLRRFHSELKSTQMVAQILLNKKISPEQAKVLQQEIQKLIKSKTADDTSLNNKINKAASLIQVNHTQIRVLKDQITELQEAISRNTNSVKFAITVLSVFDKVKDPGSVYSLNEKELKHFIKFYDAFEEPHASLITGIINTKEITYDQAQRLDREFRNYRVENEENVKRTSIPLSKKLNELRILYDSQNHDRLEFAKKRLSEINSAIEVNSKDANAFKAFAETTSSKLATQALIDKAIKSLEKVDALLIVHLGGKDKSSSRKDRKNKGSKPQSQTSEFVYETANGVETIKVSQFEDILKLKNRIEMDIKTLEGNTEIVKKDHASKSKKMQTVRKRVEEAFSYHNRDGKETSRRITFSHHLREVEKDLEGSRTALENEKAEIIAEMMMLKINYGISAEEFGNAKIRRGNSNDAHLVSFNVEKMLEKASELATTTKEFHLGKENCSTTSMKILHAGSADSSQAMFEWHEVKEGETYASNTFLSNPQSVFLAAKIVERSQKGDDTAKKMIEKKQKATPDTRYNSLLNRIADGMTTFNNVEVNIPGKNFGGSAQAQENNFSWFFYFQFIPHLFSLYRDFFQKVSLIEDKPSDSLHTRVAREIKDLNGGEKYQLIESLNASLAINNMFKAMQDDRYSIPFFETDTLARVEKYILSLEAKETLTFQEQTALQNYQRIQEERNNRVACVENAIISGSQPRAELENFHTDIDNLDWVMTEEDKVDALVKHFTVRYQEIRNKNFFSFLTSNFISVLDEIHDPVNKIQKIQEQLKLYPYLRSAQAIKDCFASYNILRTIFVQEPCSDFKLGFFKPESKVAHSHKSEKSQTTSHPHEPSKH